MEFLLRYAKVGFNSEMDKFFYDLENVLERYNQDVTALDDYEVLFLVFVLSCSGGYVKHCSLV